MGFQQRLWPILAGVVFLMGCGTTRMQSVRMASPPVIDGNVSEWPALADRESGNKFLVRASNDPDFIYLSLVVRDPKTIRSIIAGGLKTTLDGVDDGPRSLSIEFPKGLGALDYTRKNAGRRTRSTADMQDILKFMSDSAVVVDSQGVRHDEPVEVMRSSGLEVQASLSDDEYVFEMKIPFHAREGAFGSFGYPPKGIIGLRMETVRLPAADKQEQEDYFKPENAEQEVENPAEGGGRHSGMGRHGMGRGGPRRGGIESGGENAPGFKKLKYSTIIQMFPG